MKDEPKRLMPKWEPPPPPVCKLCGEWLTGVRAKTFMCARCNYDAVYAE